MNGSGQWLWFVNGGRFDFQYGLGFGDLEYATENMFFEWQSV
jgi:hypothetical protein